VRQQSAEVRHEGDVEVLGSLPELIHRAAVDFDTPHAHAASRTDPPGTAIVDAALRGLPRRFPCALARARQGHGAKSAPARERAILALLSERTMGQASARCGVGERTLRRWLTEDSEFKAEYEAARSAMFQVGMSRIQALAGRAVETLEELLGAKEYPSVRLGAARTVVKAGCTNTTRTRSSGSWTRLKRRSGNGGNNAGFFPSGDSGPSGPAGNLGWRGQLRREP
jgi:hypothetical protein